ncbi:acetylornithine aminotransferase [Savitreella phatthalungensis]
MSVARSMKAARVLIRSRGHAFAAKSARINLPAGDLQEIVREQSLSHPDPGPDSQTARLIERNAPYMVTTYARNPIVLVRGEGCKVWDLEGREYIDFNAGIAVSGLGHGDLDVANAMFDQARQIIHTSNLFHSQWTWELAKLLIEQTHADGGMRDAAKVFFSNSGTEANEAAIKFARKHGRVEAKKRGLPEDSKHKILTFRNAFHGRTMGALSATANTKYQEPFAPMVPGFVYADADMSCIEQLDESFCGVLVEPVQGEGGIFPVADDVLLALRRKCTEVGALLMFDEIQCGLGRSGKLWAHSWLPDEAHPDVLTMAKPLANGVPIGATMVTQAVADAIKIGDHGTTFGGNPLACRTAHHVLSRLSSKELLQNVQRRSHQLLSGMRAIQARFGERVIDVRGRGLLLGMQLDRDPSPLVKLARERGLLLITAGNDTIRLVPPLVLDQETCDRAIEILSRAVAAFYAEVPRDDQHNAQGRAKEAFE